MSTMARVETQTVAGTDVREVAGAMWQEIIDIYAFYGRHFPYDKQRLREDLGQILLWDMADKVIVQFYDSHKVERLSYEYTPLSDPAAVHEPPGTFPRYEISSSWSARVVAIYTTRKPASEVREFFQALGWRLVEPLIRTGAGTTERYAWFRSGGVSVSREVYKDFEEKPSEKEVAL